MTRDERIQRMKELSGFFWELVELYEKMSGNEVEVICNSYFIRTTENNYRFNDAEDCIDAILYEMKELFNF